jgi:hypothetical protein
MKHNCTGARDREMSLMWVCSCGEQVIAEELFTEMQIAELLFTLSSAIDENERTITGLSKEESTKAAFREQKEVLESILEKVRKM